MKGHKIYYCNECKKIMNEISDVYFVEQGYCRSFCSEDCIFRFFTPLMVHLEEEENKIRTDLKILNEVEFTPEKFQGLIKSTIEDPDEIWTDFNDLGEDIFYLISKLQTPEKSELWIILAVFVFENRPSLTLLASATQSEEFVNYFRIGQKVDSFNIPLGVYGGRNENVDIEQEIVPLDQETINQLECKKSELLSLLMKNRSEDDIAIEEFENYQDCLHVTLEVPDEIYFTDEDESDEFLTYIKNFQRESQSFFYVVVCYNVDEGDTENEQTLIPVFSFPSNDSEVYRTFKKGKRINGPSLN